MGTTKINNFRIHVFSNPHLQILDNFRKLSAQRLYKVKSGTTLVNALDEQGSHVKEQFLKTRRKTES